MAELEILALVTARGGSKGVPRKNVLPVGGKPLIAWTILAALGARSLNRVVVSTDDEEIAAVSREWGAQVPFMRPAELAGDTSDHISVVLHALDWITTQEGKRPDYVLLLQPTSPLRTPEDLDRCIEVAQSSRAGAVVSVTETHEHPYFLKTITPEGMLTDYLPEATSRGYVRRQDLPTVYMLNGAVYLTRSDILTEQKTFMPADTLAYLMPEERALDIDNAWDMRLADLILTTREAGAG